MVTLKRRVDRIPFASVVAIMFGVAAAILVAAVPVGMFESAVMATGLPQALSIASPPLGLKARIVAVVLAFLVVTLVSWLILKPVERWLDRDRRRRTPWADAGYAESGPATARSRVEAARKPIFAPDELGAPLMSEEALAGFEPVSPRATQAELPPLAPEPELYVPIAAEELTAPHAAGPTSDLEPWTPTTPAAGETSIHALIRRLEAGLAKRGGGPDPDAPAAAPLALSNDWIIDAGSSHAPVKSDGDGLKGALFELKRLAWR